MKIAVDAGALCVDESHRFGTSIVTENILKAIQKVDLRNVYDAYLFCKINEKNSKKIRFKRIRPTQFWSSIGLSTSEILHKHDVYLALSQSIPPVVPRRVITVSHGLSFMDFPQLYPDSYGKLREQVDVYMNRSDYVLVSSIKVKQDLEDLYKKKPKIRVLPFGIPFDMPIPEIQNVKKKYLLYVGMDHPIKNTDYILNVFNELILDPVYRDYSLYLVGNLDSFKYSHKRVRVFNKISREKLRELYRNAGVYISASLYESFNLPVLEALSQNCPVIGFKSAIIPELQPYVTVVHRKDTFVDSIKLVLKNGQEINLKSLQSKFSWNSYVKTLLSLYD